MKKRMNYPTILLRAWSMHEALRKLGFSAEEIFFAFAIPEDAKHTGYWLVMELRTQDKIFSAPIQPIGDASRESLMEKWALLAEELKTTPDAVLARIYTEHFLLGRITPAELVTKLVNQGFYFPRSTN